MAFAIGIIMLVTLAAAYLLKNNCKYTRLFPLVFSLIPAIRFAQVGGDMVTAKMVHLAQIAHLKDSGVVISSTLEQSLAASGVTADTVALTGVLANPVTLVAGILFVLIVGLILYKKA